jgi:hypothetical protein
MKKPTIYLIPRWAGHPHSDWYDWLLLEVKNKYNIDIQCLNIPDWNQPEVEKSLGYLLERIPEINSDTYFIGHSVGCQAILRFLDYKLKQYPNLKIGGFLFIAAWFKIDQPWVTLKPWLKTNDLNVDLISQNTIYKKVIISDNDPFTSDFMNNNILWKTKFNAEVTIYKNQQHFNKLMDTNILHEVEKLILSAK